MPNRIRLRWNRNQDNETKFYRVFRSETPRIEHQTNKDDIVMKVKHSLEPTVLKQYNETPRRIDARTFDLEYENIVVNEMNPFILHMDGFVNNQFMLDSMLGQVIFDDDVPERAEIIVKQYSFDGIEVWDYNLPENEKSYYGPEAKDTSSPNPPVNLSLEKDLDRNRIILRWSSASPKGKVYYYRVDAIIDDNRFSKLSKTTYAILQEPLADRPYIIERSDDGVRWMEIAKVKANEFFEYMVDRHPPSPVQNLRINAYLYKNRGKAQIVLEWDVIRDISVSKTSMYRVKAKNKVGMVSDASEVVGPIDFQVKLDYILIRRKVNDGILPSFDGSDATTIARVNDTDITQFIETTDDNIEYMYGVWVVDEAGNYSTLTYATIKVEDATAPSISFNLTGEEFHSIVG